MRKAFAIVICVALVGLVGVCALHYNAALIRDAVIDAHLAMAAMQAEAKAQAASRASDLARIETNEILREHGMAPIETADEILRRIDREMRVKH